MKNRRCALLILCFALAAVLVVPTVSAKDTMIESLRETSRAFTDVSKKAIPAVVAIYVEKSVQTGYSREGSPFDDEFFEKFFGLPSPRSPQQQRQTGQGSGFIVSEDGYILTNNHVVENADMVEVTLNDGRKMKAEIIGTDPQSDLAVIKIEGENLPMIELGDSDSLQIGEWVIAVGNPFGLEASVTVGVVSAKNRGAGITEFDDFIQTDAAINPGNSGGPLLDIDGRAIGVNTAIVSRSGGYMGIGFAIPINMAKNIKDQLVEKGKVTRGFLGIYMDEVRPEVAEYFGLKEARGVSITNVVEDTPADKAGLKQGDIILEIDGDKVKDPRDLKRKIAGMPPGEKVKLLVFRDGKEEKIKVTLGNRDKSDFSVGSENSKIAERFGLQVQNLTDEVAERLGFSIDDGVLVTQVIPGSDADRKGIRAGVVIVSVNNDRVKSVEDFNKALKNADKALLLINDGRFARYVVVLPDDK